MRTVLLILLLPVSVFSQSLESRVTDVEQKLRVTGVALGDYCHMRSTGMLFMGVGGGLLAFSKPNGAGVYVGGVIALTGFILTNVAHANIKHVSKYLTSNGVSIPLHK